MRAFIWSLPVVVAATFSPSAARPGASPPRLSAVDLEAGALLVEVPESAGVGIERYAAWHLTDGRDDAGWRSPEGAPQGASFVWELDATWRLDTLLVSTKGVEDRAAPGAAVKTVELYVAPREGEWTSAGQFTIGKHERKELPLPAGTTAARVRLIVLENHGNAFTTELSEVALYGARTEPTAALTLDGDYRTAYGAMRFVQDGMHITGCFDAGTESPPVQMAGTLSGRVARMSWSEPGEAGPGAERSATFTFNGEQLRGTTYTDGQPDGVLWGVRVSASRGPACLPPRPPQDPGRELALEVR